MDPKLDRLFEKMKAAGFFWSYSKDINASQVKTEILVETVLKYGDVDDIRVLFERLDYGTLFEAWVKRVIFDRRFDRLNFYLAKIFFDVDLKKVRRERAGDDRRNKLERLAFQYQKRTGKNPE